ncbi:Glyco-hydro-79C domain-containing protein [Mycena indigotica]|uniref:Glyco-hydro-79C domain-containing protein n=1 Tax=Mycena indigotica TaxID=2126181 RepID=A0A8H6SW93_9AGAR|nr:Glyco-hydro-79C domain-containing protein [Mycena indigotica]KAF7306443.1 Glyco-hydro-79C domain-containing protein [Mycena indigotica]
MLSRLIPISFLLLQTIFVTNAAIQVVVPSTPSGSNVVDSNFLGISFELSFMTEYFGNDTQHINMPILNYLGAIRARTAAKDPIRIRIGGNSADSSPYFSPSASPMVQLVPGNYNFNDQPVTYNSMIWSVMSGVSKSIGGVAYAINIPLAIFPNATMADDIRSILGSDLDSMLLGNEPDLYTGHNKRPNQANYTVTNYIDEYKSALAIIGTKDAAGKADIGGPSICCNWDLEPLLKEGYLSNFTGELKYIVLQHYPQNNCNPGVFKYQLPWYLQHANVVELAQWQKPGIDYLLSQPADRRPKLINSEFNSASCGGVPFSPSFAVGSLWSIDYALQMASVGYSQAYIHTREAGISYNLIKPPTGPPGSAGAWVTNSPYYALLVAAEALVSDHGVIVQDLNLEGSSSNPNVTTSGYAIYNANNKTVSRLVLINAANGTSADFALPAAAFRSSGTALVKFLAAARPEEETNITWGGETWSGPQVTDGKATQKPAWAVPNQNLKDCAQNGCSVIVPGPSLAIVFLDGMQNRVIAAVNPSDPASVPVKVNNGSTSGSGNSNNGSGHNGGTKGHSGALSLQLSMGAGALFVLLPWAVWGSF